MKTTETMQDKVLAAALHPWKVKELRAIQADWNQREDGGLADWTLADVVSVLIWQEHERILRVAREEAADETETAD